MMTRSGCSMREGVVSFECDGTSGCMFFLELEDEVQAVHHIHNMNLVSLQFQPT